MVINMKVKELIEKLEKVENKEKDIVLTLDKNDVEKINLISKTEPAAFIIDILPCFEEYEFYALTISRRKKESD